MRLYSKIKAVINFNVLGHEDIGLKKLDPITLNPQVERK